MQNDQSEKDNNLKIRLFVEPTDEEYKYGLIPYIIINKSLLEGESLTRNLVFVDSEVEGVMNQNNMPDSLKEQKTLSVEDSIDKLVEELNQTSVTKKSVNKVEVALKLSRNNLGDGRSDNEREQDINRMKEREKPTPQQTKKTNADNCLIAILIEMLKNKESNKNINGKSTNSQIAQEIEKFADNYPWDEATKKPCGLSQRTIRSKIDNCSEYLKEFSKKSK